MDYFKQIKAFYSRQLINPLTSPDVSLWHALMFQSNALGWPTEFNVPMSTLCIYTGLSTSAVKRSRNNLATVGLIKWHQRKGRASASYSLVALYEPQSEPQGAPQPAPQSEPQPAPQGGPIHKHKTENNISSSIEEDNKRKAKSRSSCAKSLVDSWTQDPELRELLHEWLDVRKAQRAANTEGAIKQNLAKLPELAQQSGLSMQDYVREIIRRSWRAFYPIRDAQPRQARRDDGRDFDWLTGK